MDRGLPPLHALLGLGGVGPRDEGAQPPADDGEEPSETPAIAQLKELLLGPAGELLMTAQDVSGRTPLHAYVAQPPALQASNAAAGGGWASR